MRIARFINAGVLVFCLATPGQITTAAAAEQALTGAWVQGGEQCQGVFTRGGKSVAFKKPVNPFAPAFIISGNQIRTPGASCRIKGSKSSGNSRILALACTTSVSTDEVPARLEPMPDGTLRRYLNAEDKVGSKYERCSL
jgi:hypothetical protein